MGAPLLDERSFEWEKSVLDAPVTVDQSTEKKAEQRSPPLRLMEGIDRP